MSEIIIDNPKMICTKCGYELSTTDIDLLEERVFNDELRKFHRVKSVVKNGGSRLCGPVE